LTDGELIALIAGMLSKSHYAQNTRHDIPLLRSRAVLHFISEWHSVLTTGLHLNNATLNPLAPPSIAQLFDGETLVHYLSKTENKDVNYKKQLLKNQSDIELFDKVYAAVCDGAVNKVKREEAANKKQEVKTIEARKEAAAAEKRAATARNQFGALLNEEETAEADAEKKKKKKNKNKKATVDETNAENNATITTTTTIATAATTTEATTITTAITTIEVPDANVKVKLSKKDKKQARQEELANFHEKLVINDNNDNNTNKSSNKAAAKKGKK